MSVNSYFLPADQYTWTNALSWGNYTRHREQAKQGSWDHRLVHALAAVAEFLPIISQIVSIFEKFLSACCQSSHLESKKLDSTRVKDLTENSSTNLSTHGLSESEVTLIQTIDSIEGEISTFQAYSNSDFMKTFDQLTTQLNALLKGKSTNTISSIFNQQKQRELMQQIVKTLDVKDCVLLKNYLENFDHELRFVQELELFLTEKEVCDSAKFKDKARTLEAVANGWMALGDIEQAHRIGQSILKHGQEKTRGNSYLELGRGILINLAGICWLSLKDQQQASMIMEPIKDFCENFVVDDFQIIEKHQNEDPRTIQIKTFRPDQIRWLAAECFANSDLKKAFQWVQSIENKEYRHRQGRGVMDYICEVAIRTGQLQVLLDAIEMDSILGEEKIYYSILKDKCLSLHREDLHLLVFE